MVTLQGLGDKHQGYGDDDLEREAVLGRAKLMEAKAETPAVSEVVVSAAYITSTSENRLLDFGIQHKPPCHRLHPAKISIGPGRSLGHLFNASPSSLILASFPKPPIQTLI